MRGRNRNKGPNPLTRSYESNGPDVKIRGTAQHIAEKYSQLARDAQASGDPVAAENYFQHAEHYFRIIAAAQEQLREQFGYQNRPFEEESEDEGGFAPERSGFPNGGEESEFNGQPQSQLPFEPREANERPPRFEPRDNSERQPRFDRGDRNERGERGDRRERFSRGGRQRPDNQGESRSEFRHDRRREENNDTAAAEQPGLPAFLTTPLRAPVSVEGESAEAASPDNGAAEANGEFRTRRPRRRRRGFSDEEGGAAETPDFATEGAKPPAAE
ncbi:DUF4167 domain-containing protein [Microvirga massiliensis]|uniref:DUF4167 domain-containing protein n=1 Tax=Microvirga massiliensis TaxID=1033741 RepID=UPI0006607283|nr:DUF4167 domain-containing protein [Microvirga massiliensis]